MFSLSQPVSSSLNFFCIFFCIRLQSFRHVGWQQVFSSATVLERVTKSLRTTVMHGARGHDGFWPVQNLSDDEAITELCQPNSIAKFYDTEFFVLPVVSPTY